MIAMSALPLKADMCGATTDVCFGPKADMQKFGARQKYANVSPALCEGQVLVRHFDVGRTLEHS